MVRFEVCLKSLRPPLHPPAAKKAKHGAMAEAKTDVKGV